MRIYVCYYFSSDVKSCFSDFDFRLFFFRSAADRFLQYHPIYDLLVLNLSFSL